MMRFLRRFFLAISMASTFSGTVQAAGVHGNFVEPSTNDARSWLLMDYHSGFVLAEKNIDRRFKPGHLVKLAGVYALCTAIRKGESALDREVHISPDISYTLAPKMFIRPGTVMPVFKLLQSIMIHSANDAALALAIDLDGSEEEFIGRMNEQLQALPLENTQFSSFTHITKSGQYTTARDMVTLAHAFITDFPDYYRWYGEKKIKDYKFSLYNPNALLWRDEGTDGVQVSLDRYSGNHFLISAARNDMRLIVAVMGAKSEGKGAAYAQKLLDYGFARYETVLIKKANAPVTAKRIWYGDESILPLGTEKDVNITIPRGSRERLVANVEIDSLNEAPVKLKQKVGVLHILYDDQPVEDIPLLALKEIKRGNIFERVVDGIILWGSSFGE